MPLSSRFLNCIVAVTSNGVYKTAMSSSRFNARSRNQWPHGFCYRAPVQGYRGLTDVDAFERGESNTSDARGAHLAFPQVYNRAFYHSWEAQQQQYWHWRHAHPFLPPQSADCRNWIHAVSQIPREHERFKVLSYNILADYLALDHQSSLYYHIPNHILAWEWRKWRLLIEFDLWSPDIMCLQEVDRFHDLEGELAIRGYAGIWKMRTGNAVDGCAIFWRTNRFYLRYEEHIEFNKLGLRDNVAQICVLESKMRNQVEYLSQHLPASCSQSSGANQVIICNTHVLYNPKRGEIKLGQVRVLLHRAYAVSKDWNNAPVVVCGDFNTTPKSPLYNFINTQRLNLSGLARDQISGQYSASLNVRPYYGFSSYSRDQSESAFASRQGYYKRRPEYQHNTVNPYRIENSAAVMYPDVQLQVDRQVSVDATSIKLGEVKIFSQPAGEGSTTHSKHANIPSRTSEISRRQSIARFNSEADKNNEGAEKVSFDGNFFSSEVQEGQSTNETQISVVDSIKNTLEKPYFESSNVSPERIDFARGIKSPCIDNSIASSSLPQKINLHGFQKDRNYVGNAAASFRNNVDDSSIINSCEGLSSDATAVGKIFHTEMADDTLSKEKTSTSYACLEIPLVENTENLSIRSTVAQKAVHLITCFNSGQDDGLDLYKSDGSHLSDRMVSVSVIEDKKVMEKMDSDGDNKKVSSDNILQEVPSNCGNLSNDANSAESRLSLEENKDHHSPELSGLDENSDPIFFKELLGMEMNDFNSPSTELLTDPPFSPSSDVFYKERYSYNPYCWSSMEMEIASGKANCTVVEHPLKLRSVYRDVEDYRGTKDASREPQVTSYNLQFMGTVDYIWCSDDLLTVAVLDTIPKHVMQYTHGFPTEKWGSDHIALVSELAFAREK